MNTTYSLSIEEAEYTTTCLQYWTHSTGQEAQKDIPSDDIKENLRWMISDIENYLTSTAKEHLYSRIQEIASSSNQNIQRLIRSVLERRSEFRGVSFLREETSEMLTSDGQKIDSILYNYYTNLFRSNQSQEDWEIPQEWQQYYSPVSRVPQDTSSLAGEITMTEIWTILSTASKDFTPGPDQISWQTLNNIPIDHPFWSTLLKEFNTALETGNIPSEWNKGRTILQW
jgi:hypothetical protein